MKAHPYYWFALLTIALLGFALAFDQHLKSTKTDENRWASWTAVMTLFVWFDSYMLIHSADV